jgi:hypothetical protein
MIDLYRRELMHIAEEVYRNGPVAEGGTAQARFSREVAKIKGQQDEAKKKAVAKAA